MFMGVDPLKGEELVRLFPFETEVSCSLGWHDTSTLVRGGFHSPATFFFFLRQKQKTKEALNSQQSHLSLLSAGMTGRIYQA